MTQFTFIYTSFKKSGAVRSRTKSRTREPSDYSPDALNQWGYTDAALQWRSYFYLNFFKRSGPHQRVELRDSSEFTSRCSNKKTLFLLSYSGFK